MARQTKTKTPRQLMTAELKRSVIPELLRLGFSGVFPHFRRITSIQTDLLSFQYHRFNDAFVIEVGFCAPGPYNSPWGGEIQPDNLSTNFLDLTHRSRLRPQEPKTDPWIAFSSDDPASYRRAARVVIPLLDTQAADFWNKHEPTMAQIA